MIDELKEQKRLPRQWYLDPYEALKLAVGKSASMTKDAFGEYLVKHLLEFFHKFKTAGEGALDVTPSCWLRFYKGRQVRENAGDGQSSSCLYADGTHPTHSLQLHQRLRHGMPVAQGAVRVAHEQVAGKAAGQRFAVILGGHSGRIQEGDVDVVQGKCLAC
jgi:hypothetical protein